MISVKTFVFIFLKSSQLLYVLKFHTERSVFLVVGFGGILSSKNQHLKTVLKSADLRAIRSEGIWLGRHLFCDLFQQGPQTMDLRESLCRIMRATGSGVTQTYFLYMSEASSYPETGTPLCKTFSVLLWEAFRSLTGLFRQVLPDVLKGKEAR